MASAPRLSSQIPAHQELENTGPGTETSHTLAHARRLRTRRPVHQDLEHGVHRAPRLRMQWPVHQDLEEQSGLCTKTSNTLAMHQELEQTVTHTPRFRTQWPMDRDLEHIRPCTETYNTAARALRVLLTILIHLAIICRCTAT